MIDGVFEALDFYDRQGWFAKGWAFDPARPGHSVGLELWSEAGRLAAFRADLARPDLISVGIGNGGHAFEVRLPEAVLDGHPHIIQIVAEGRKVLQQSPKVFSMPRFRGRIETVTGLIVEGWAKDELAPSVPPTLDILVDDQRIAQTLAGRMRADLIGSLGTSGHNAFRVALPPTLCDGIPHRIALRFTNSAIELDGSPFQIRFSAATLPPRLERAYRGWCAQCDDIEQQRCRWERIPIRPIHDAMTYRRWLAQHEEQWETPGTVPRDGVPISVIAAPGDDSGMLVSLVARLEASGRDCELIVDAPMQPSTAMHVVSLPTAGNAFLHEALRIARGDFAILIPPGARPHPSLISECQRALQTGDADAVYFDDDALDENGERLDPHFKPDWDPDRFVEHNYIGLTACVRRSALVDAARRVSSDGPHLWGAVIEIALLELAPDRIRHLPFVLWHRSASGDDEEPPAARAARIQSFMSARNVPVQAESGPNGVRLRRLLPAQPPAVTLIIPTRDRVDLLQRCIHSILDKTDYPSLSIIVVDNGSRDAGALGYLAELEGQPAVSVLRSPGPFNYSALNNKAVARADTPLIGLLNNDVEVVTPDWLTEMVGHAVRPEVGAVGSKLLFPDGSIQHGGIIVGFYGAADNAQQAFSDDEPGYLRSAVTTQNVCAVTGACLVCRRDAYLAVGGLDEKDFAISFNDVDLCLKLRQRGLRIIWTPHAVLYHHESATRGADRSAQTQAREEQEVTRLRSKWDTERCIDPFYSPNLTRTGYSYCDFAWPGETVNASGREA